ncbi:MAG: polyprenyl synthetase family protein [Bdellovibrionales bacterium]|nr:polyprenyl synthetase family protein [Bdellovibrionales bacterium]
MKNPSDSFAQFLPRVRGWVDAHLNTVLHSLAWHPRMESSARYVVTGGGKAARPALIFWSYAQWSGNDGRPPQGALDLALALEFVHSYSLVHDDLPCMDNDDFRRGRPTLHRIEGEAVAVLAGDALLTGAFEILAQSAVSPRAQICAVGELSRAAGGAGMVAGQMMDLDLKSRAYTVDSLTRNHDLKTGALFGAALALGYLAATESPQPATLNAARVWGVKLGLLFQVVDDVLDANPLTDAKGDEGPNFVNLLGLEATRQLAVRLQSELAREAQALGFQSAATASLLEFFVHRTV